MTRINSAINPKNLTDQHLLAELRELPRVFTAVKKRIDNNVPFNDIPKEFTLGTGHVKFFYDKTYFLTDRFVRLRDEYLNRFGKFHITPITVLNIIGEPDYNPTVKERHLLIERISTRISESNQIPKYYRKTISKEQAISILKS